MADKEIVIKRFIKNFIQEDRAERALFELSSPKKGSKFKNRLNHNWQQIFKMKNLLRVDKKDDFPGKIKELLHFGDNEMCYLICNYDDFDDKLLSFCEAFEKIYPSGFASLLININADTLLLITEQEQGAAPKFIGKIK